MSLAYPYFSVVHDLLSWVFDLSEDYPLFPRNMAVLADKTVPI